MSWPSAIEWVAIIGTLGTLTSLVLAWGARDTKQILERMDTANKVQHAHTQGMMERMDQGTKALLDRMDRAAEQRQAEIKAILERRTP